MSPETMPELVKIRKAVERLADAQEAANKADPLTMLSQMAEEGAMAEPQQSFASNGATHMYALPVQGWYIVAREDAGSESGYTVAIERA